MPRLLPFPKPAAPEPDRPTLHLSGPKLAAELERLVAASEEQGGVERLVEATRLKSELFRALLADGNAAILPLDAFEQLCAFMPTCRRRVAEAMARHGYHALREAVASLLDGAADTATADRRLAGFQAAFPQDRQHRWVRDLAAELLHFTLPELYPLMTRWVWDAHANTGVLREIWHGDDVDHMIIDIADEYPTFLVLRQELCQFLSDNGVFRDVLFYADVLKAQVYAGYIEAQGGAYLKTDFNAVRDPLVHVRRMLGLDGIDTRSGRSRFKSINAAGRASAGTRLLS